MAVVAAGELHDHVAAREGAGQAQGAHRRLGARADQADRLDGRDARAHLLREGHLARLRRAERQAARRLLLHRRDDLRVRVSHDHRPPGAHQIDVLAAVHIGEQSTLRRGQERRRASHRSERTHRRVHARRDDAAGLREQLLGESAGGGCGRRGSGGSHGINGSAGWRAQRRGRRDDATRARGGDVASAEVSREGEAGSASLRPRRVSLRSELCMMSMMQSSLRRHTPGFGARRWVWPGIHRCGREAGQRAARGRGNARQRKDTPRSVLDDDVLHRPLQERVEVGIDITELLKDANVLQRRLPTELALLLGPDRIISHRNSASAPVGPAAGRSRSHCAASAA